jgi:hypothetical protein
MTLNLAALSAIMISVLFYCYTKCNNAECRYAELNVVMLNVVMHSVVTLNVVMHSVVAPDITFPGSSTLYFK